MTKRAGTTELNQDNWNEDDPTEERGFFKMGTPSELKMRTIKRGRRRGLANESESGSIFKTFKAFANPTTETLTPTFSFLSEVSDKPKLTTSNPFPPFSFGNKIENKSPTASVKEGDSKTTGENATKPPSKDITFSFSGGGSNTSPVSKPLLPLQSTNSGESQKQKAEPTFKFGLHTNSKETAQQTPSGSTFKFGLNASEGVDSTKSPGDSAAFKFGIPKSSEAGNKPVESTFKFGMKPDSESGNKKSSEQAFKFGIGSNENNETKPSTTSKSVISSSLSFSFTKDDGKSTKEPFKITSNVNGLDSDNSKCNNSTFLAKLKALNFGVLKWVNQHLDKNPYINLKPIFDDYEQHFLEIKEKYGASNSVTEDQKADNSRQMKENSKGSSGKLGGLSSSSTKPASSTPTFNFGCSNTLSSKINEPFTFGQASSTAVQSSTSPQNTGASDSAKQASSTPLFSFGLIKDKPITSTFSFGSTDPKKPSSFSFGSDNGSKKTSGFSFGAQQDGAKSTTTSTSTFSFKSTSPSSAAAPSTGQDAAKEDEASDDVPNVEVTEVKEDDAIYEKKVKLFYKKDDKYVDRGVGTLFLKPAGDKTQLVIRAMTNLGNILLNIILNKSIPTQRMGKNNVLIVCVPNPAIDAKDPTTPVSMLIRVKTTEDADELLEQIDEHKK